MPNPNYNAGRRQEYSSRKRWQKEGWIVVRSAGSHGIWDLAALYPWDPEKPIHLIQVKRTDDLKAARALITRFKKDPPLPKSTHWVMVLEVNVKGSKEVLSAKI